MATTTSQVQPPARSTELIDVIAERWSPRAFDKERTIEGWKLRSIFEAARWAPSCYNEQPWRFIVGDKASSPESWNAILDVLVPQNQEWAKNAPVLMLGIVKLKFTFNGKPNRHAQHDLGLAVENMVLQAQSLDIYTHQMGGILPEKAMDVFGIPRGEYDVLTGIAMGYKASPDTLSKELKERELQPADRKPLHELAFTRYWEGPSVF